MKRNIFKVWLIKKVFLNYSTYLLLLFQMLFTGLFAQNDQWTVFNFDDEPKVKYKLTEHVDLEGNKQKLVYYSVEIEKNIDLFSAKKYLLDGSNFKYFIENVEESYEVKRLNDDEFELYLFFDFPWPISNADCTQHVKVDQFSPDELWVYVTSNSNIMEMKEVKRMDWYNAKYHFKKVAEDLVRLELSVDFVPASNTPDWMLKKWFPKGPQQILNNLVRNISSMN